MKQSDTVPSRIWPLQDAKARDALSLICGEASVQGKGAHSSCGERRISARSIAPAKKRLRAVDRGPSARRATQIHGGARVNCNATSRKAYQHRKQSAHCQETAKQRNNCEPKPYIYIHTHIYRAHTAPHTRTESTGQAKPTARTEILVTRRKHPATRRRLKATLVILVTSTDQ